MEASTAPGIRIDPSEIVADDPIDLVERLLAEGVLEGASDIHFDPDGDGGTVRRRIDGFFTAKRRLGPRLYERCLGRLKLLGRLVVYRQDVPQEGRIDLDDDNRRGDLRLSVMPTPFGEKAVVRVFQADYARLDLADLGLSDPVVAALTRLLRRPQGALLATGPCSSGKTTTLYAMLRQILRERGDHAHVVTLEDPVECRLPGVTQLEVNRHRGISFETGLRTLLRQDPEVLMVGEVRDGETAKMLAEAALTGHLVLTSLHVGRPEEAIVRLGQMGIEPYVVASALSAVLSQRLVRRVCPACATPDDTEPPPWAAERLREAGRRVRGAGCQRCRNTGYLGRVAIGTVIEVDDELRDVIVTRPDRKRLTAAIKEHGTGLSDDGVRAVCAGLTTVSELSRVLGDEFADGGSDVAEP